MSVASEWMSGTVGSADSCWVVTLYHGYPWLSMAKVSMLLRPSLNKLKHLSLVYLICFKVSTCHCSLFFSDGIDMDKQSKR